MQGNFADQTLFTPAKPAQSIPVESTNDTLQGLELDQSDLNTTEDLLASPEKSTIEVIEGDIEEDEGELDTPNNDEVSFENIPIVEDVTPTKSNQSESPDPIIAQQEIVSQSEHHEVELTTGSELNQLTTKQEIQESEPLEAEPKDNIEKPESPVQSTPEPDEEIIEENVITDTDSLKNDISESDIRKVAEDLIDQTLDNVEQKLKTDSIVKLEEGDASTEAEVRAKQLAEIETLMKEKGMGDLDPQQTKMYLE